MLIIIVRTLMTLFVLAVLALFIVEYAVGCGETYVTAEGLRVAQDCVIIPMQH
jgi:hypothetical protein